MAKHFPLCLYPHSSCYCSPSNGPVPLRILAAVLKCSPAWIWYIAASCLISSRLGFFKKTKKKKTQNRVRWTSDSIVLCTSDWTYTAALLSLCTSCSCEQKDSLEESWCPSQWEEELSGTQKGRWCIEQWRRDVAGCSIEKSTRSLLAGLEESWVSS